MQFQSVLAGILSALIIFPLAHAEKRIQFKMNWPEKGCVPIRSETSKKDQTLESTFDLCWVDDSARKDTLLVSIKNFSVQKFNGGPVPKQLAEEFSKNKLPAIFIEKSTGRFKSVDEKSLKASFARAEKSILKEGGKDVQEKIKSFKKMTEMMLTEPTLKAQFTESTAKPWNFWVAGWTGEYTLGENSDGDMSLSLKDLGDGKYRFERSGPIDIKAVEKAMNAMGEIMAPGKSPKLKVKEGQLKATAITDKNLRPVKVSWNEEIVLEGDGNRLKGTESNVYEFNWKDLK